MRLISLAIATAMLATLAGCGDDQPPAAPMTPLKIVLIVPDTTDPFWQQVREGAQAAADDSLVELTCPEPKHPNQPTEQAALIRATALEGVDGLVLAPLADFTVFESVTQAQKEELPIVAVRTPLPGTPGETYAALVTSDHARAGQQAVEALLQAGGDKARVIMLRYNPNAQDIGARESSFRAALATQAPKAIVTVHNEYGGVTLAEAQAKATELLTAIRQGDAVFTSHPTTTEAMLLTLERAGLTGKKMFIGFGRTPRLLQALRDGKIQVLLIENPRAMGNNAIRTLAAQLRGQTPPTTSTLPVGVLTRETIDTPDMQAMLK